METMQKRQDERRDSLMEKRMKEVFVRWLQENDYGAEHNSLRKLPESADCGLAENMRREYEVKVMGF